MTLDDALAAAVSRAVEPMAAELRSLRTAVEDLRHAQPAQMLSVAQAAERLGISTCTVRRRVADGTLPSKHVGRRVLVPADTIQPVDDAEVARLAAAARAGR